MKNLTHLDVPKDIQAKFPFGTIQNETPTQEGTPVYRELYGDILTNIWKIIELSGIAFIISKQSPKYNVQSPIISLRFITYLPNILNL